MGVKIDCFGFVHRREGYSFNDYYEMNIRDILIGV